MQYEADKSDREKTREYAKKKWLEYHPEDEDKIKNMLTRGREHTDPKKQPNKNEMIFCAVSGIISSLVVIGLWIALFSNIDIGVFVLPFFIASTYFFSTMYIRKGNGFDKICLFFVVFYVANLITSIVGWFSSSTNVSGTAIFTIILSAYMYWFMTRNLQ